MVARGSLELKPDTSAEEERSQKAAHEPQKQKSGIMQVQAQTTLDSQADASALDPADT